MQKTVMVQLPDRPTIADLEEALRDIRESGVLGDAVIRFMSSNTVTRAEREGPKVSPGVFPKYVVASSGA